MRVWTGVAVAVLLVAGCSSDDESEPSASDTTVGTEIAARATYSGDACEYEGPDEYTVGTEFSIIVVNTTTHDDVVFGLAKVPEGTTAEEVAEAGIEAVVEDDLDEAPFVPAPTSQDVEYELSGVVNVAGTWVLNCHVFRGNAEDDLDYPVVLTFTDS